MNNGIEYIDKPGLSSFDLSQITRPHILDTYPTLPTQLSTLPATSRKFFTLLTTTPETTTITATTTTTTTTPQMQTDSKIVTSMQNLITKYPVDDVTTQQKPLISNPLINLNIATNPTLITVLPTTGSTIASTSHFNPTDKNKVTLPSLFLTSASTVSNKITESTSPTNNTLLMNPSNNCQECSISSEDCKKSENFNCCICKLG
jgi:hypothetical protein